MLFETEKIVSPAAPREASRFTAHGPVPQLGLTWPRRSRNFAESIGVVLHGPRAPRTAQNAFLRDCSVSGKLSRVPLLFSLLWHAAFVVLILSLGRLAVAKSPEEVSRQQELVWYGAIHDLPNILPLSRPTPKVAPAAEEAETERSSAAFHPRLTIINRPVRPNHPRQTLIQPDAPPEPPKILPPLPNIVEWDAPSRPRLDAAALALRQAKPRAATVAQDVAAPELHDGAKQLEGLALPAPEPALLKPALPVNAIAQPRAAAVRAAEAAAPEAGAFGAGDGSGRQLIALSAAPAPVAPPSEPLGNLSSRLNISPDGKPGAPGDSASKSGGGAGGGGTGPAGLSITGGTRRMEPGAAGSGRLPVQPGMAAVSASPATMPARVQPAQPGSAPASITERVKLGLPPESLLDGKRSYSLNVNMPNLTSAAGSWILRFAEMDQPDDQPGRTATRAGELQGPEPLRKVDPKYPPLLRSGNVQGEVLLYAVIRKDGTVDSIQLLSGVDPVLDSNAMQALAQWKFRPGRRQGEPVDLEAIVHIPMRNSAPQN